MFIEATKIIGLPVAAFDTQSKAGIVSDILIDPDNGNLLGFLINEGILVAKKVLAISDVKEWDPNGLVTESIENLVGINDVVRIKELIDKKVHLLGMRAKTESGKSLGEVENYLVDSTCQCVTKYYLKDILGKKRILTADKVIKINKIIVFSDEISEPPKGAVGAPAA